MINHIEIQDVVVQHERGFGLQWCRQEGVVSTGSQAKRGL